MSDLERITNRFKELHEKGKAIPLPRNDYGERSLLPDNYYVAYAWATSARHLIKIVFGEESIHFRDFSTHYNPSPHRIIMDFVLCLAVFEAAKNDFENGLLLTQKSLIEANVLGSAIQQAGVLFDKEYIQAAAIVAGVALETQLRSMCVDNNLQVEDDAAIHVLNTKLYNAGKYSQPTMQEITTWANIRNGAAHGKWGEFTKQQVDLMIKGITRFLSGS